MTTKLQDITWYFDLSNDDDRILHAKLLPVLRQHYADKPRDFVRDTTGQPVRTDDFMYTGRDWREGLTPKQTAVYERRDSLVNTHEQPAPRPGRKVTDKEVFELADILYDVREILYASIEKHAPMCSAHDGHSVIREEFEELWEHVKADTGNSREAYKEALQTAAMAIRFALDVVSKENRK